MKYGRALSFYSEKQWKSSLYAHFHQLWDSRMEIFLAGYPLFIRLSAFLVHLSAVFIRLSALFTFLSAVFGHLSAVSTFLSALYRYATLYLRTKNPAIRKNGGANRWYLSYFDPAVFDGCDNRLCTVVYIHLLQDARYVVFNCLFRDVECLTNCTVGLAIR